MQKAQLKKRYGPLAMVTGASSGIGEQFAHVLAENGFDLLLVARSRDKLESLASSLSAEHSVEVEPYPCDLSSPEAVDNLVQHCESKPIGLVVSNAGFGAKGEFLSHDPQMVRRMYQTNSLTPSQLVFGLLPAMKARRQGGIIFTGSVEGEVAFPWSTPYAASKAFVHSLARGLWLELKEFNVDVLLLAPGSTDTEAPLKQGMTREQLIGLLPPRQVAEEALAALGKRSTITPGAVNRGFITFLKMLPRQWATIVAGRGMKKAIEDARRSQQENQQ